jgi:F0F1-type ATP synthase delta subunit
LTADQKTALQSKLARALNRRQVVLDEVVDPTLLGGFVAESGSVIVDGSLDGQLARVRQRLARA